MIQHLTEEEYFKLYPQMRGQPLEVQPVSPEEVNRRYARRRQLNNTNFEDKDWNVSTLPPVTVQEAKGQSEWDHRDGQWQYAKDSKGVIQATYQEVKDE